jgi:hypothetical protein
MPVLLLTLMFIPITLYGDRSLSIVTDRPVYSLGDTVTMTISIQNERCREHSHFIDLDIYDSSNLLVDSILGHTQEDGLSPSQFPYQVKYKPPKVGSYTAKLYVFHGYYWGARYVPLEDTATFQVVGRALASGFDFNLALSPSSVSVKQGAIASFKILLAYSDPSYEGTIINIQVAGLGSGMNWGLTQAGDLTITTSSTTPTGTYTIVVIGSAQGVTRQTSGSLTVTTEQTTTQYTIDWALSNPSLSPSSPKVGDLVTFDITVNQLSSNWPGWLTVYLNVKLDGNAFDTVWVYNNQPGPIPVGITKTVSTKPWTATEGTHLVTWQLMFAGGDGTVVITDPFPYNNQASLLLSVSAATSTPTVTQTITQTVTQTSTSERATTITSTTIVSLTTTEAQTIKIDWTTPVSEGARTIYQFLLRLNPIILIIVGVLVFLSGKLAKFVGIVSIILGTVFLVLPYIL